jgi:hypothetical protein
VGCLEGRPKLLSCEWAVGGVVVVWGVEHFHSIEVDAVVLKLSGAEHEKVKAPLPNSFTERGF